MRLLFLVFVFKLQNCEGIIYRLNDLDYSRLPKLYALDDYNDCLLKDGTYCLAKYQLYADGNNSLMSLIQEYSQYTVRHYNYTYIERGTCILHSYNKTNLSKTTKSELEYALDSHVNETVWKNYGLRSELATVYYCDKQDEHSEIDTLDWVVVAIIAFFIFMNICASFYDLYSSKNTENSYLLSFSTIRNWKALVSPSKHERVEKLKGFRGMRFIATFFMMVAHVNFLNTSGFTDNPQDLEKSYERFPSTLIYGGMMLMQVFFVLTGFLLTYYFNLSTETITVSWKFLPLMWFNRWWRLTPSNAMMLAIYATWLRHLGSGPLWNLAVTPVAMECRQYWWHHLLYFNNYVSDVGKACMIQSWQISADSQLFIVGVTIWGITQKRGRKTAMALLLLIGIMAPAVHVWWYDLDGVILLFPEMMRTMVNDTYFKLHVLGHNNLSSFIIGMITGDLMYRCEKKKIKFSKYKILRFLLWCVIPAILLMIYSANVIFYAEGERPALWIRMLYQGLHRPIFGLIVAYGIAGIIMKFDATICSVFDWNGWLVPSRLCYCAYLIHFIFVHYLLGVRTQLGHVSFFTMSITHFGVVWLSFIWALPLYLIVENPMSNIVKILIKIKTNKPVPTNNITDDTKLTFNFRIKSDE